MAGELVRTGVAGLETKDEVAVLVSLLSLTTDAVLVFDENGVIVLANDEAAQLFRSVPGSLVDSNVHQLFPPAATLEQEEGSLEGSLPFVLDGSSSTVICEGSDQQHLRVRVRCEQLATSVCTYLLCAHVMTDEGGIQDENERLVDELSRANRRLSGTLSIVLGTLDSMDVGTLFSRILEEITQTMDAWASMVFMAEREGYRLRGMSDDLHDTPVPTFMPYDFPLAELVAQQGRSLCMRVKPLTRDDLRSGAISRREIVEEETGATMKVPAKLLPPCPSFVVVPIWFGGHMIALIMVGWRHSHRLRKDDARLLDSVAEYLSVQLAGAFAALQTQHEERLESLGSSLRESLLSESELSRALVTSVFAEAAQGLEATAIPLEGNVHQHTTMGVLPHEGHVSVPLDLPALCRSNTLPRILATSEAEGLEAWLQSKGQPSRGLVVLLGSLMGTDVGWLMLRNALDEPFEEVDTAFVRRLADDVVEIAAGEQARQRDKRISQALQQGMRNELQSVEGISAQSCYSSATEAAYVGGDFYDLVRLPHRRACVIMGDVSGKGVEAASVSSAVKTALGAYAWEGLAPARMVELLNDFLLGFSRIETFATLFVGIVDLAAGTLTYCSAGHPPALMVRASSGEMSMLGVQSGVVGAFEGLQYRNGETPIHPGDFLLLYTDGVTEARNPEGAFFGEDGLRDVVATEVEKGFEQLCDRVLEGVESFAGGSLEDDVALVITRFDEVGA